MNRLRQEIQACMRDPAPGPDGSWSATFLFPPGFVGFQGHFPGRPVLPGMCNILAVLVLWSAALGAPARLLEVCSAKFAAPVGPSRELRVVCRPAGGDGEGGRVLARLFLGEVLAARMELRVAPGGPEAAP